MISIYILTWYRKRNQKANRSTACSYWRNKQWRNCLRFTLSMVYRIWTKACRDHHFSSFVLYDNFLWTGSLHLSLLSVHSNGSTPSKNKKGTSIWKDHMAVNMKVKMLYVKVKALYKSGSYVKQDYPYPKYYITLHIHSIRIMLYITVCIMS